MRTAVLQWIVLSALLAGCVAPTDEPSCDGEDVVVEIVAPKPVEGVAHVRAGNEVRVAAHIGDCPRPDGFRWTLEELPGLGGGFPGDDFRSDGAATLFTPPHPGAYTLKVELLDDDGRRLARSATSAPLFVYFVVDAVMPSDGSTYEAGFRTFCCPVAHSIKVTREDGAVQTQWQKTIVAGGRVVWHGTGNGSDAASAYRDVLGDDWFKELDLRVRPADETTALVARNEYRVEIRIGPSWGHLYSV